MNRTFVDAADYVNRNQPGWNKMIMACYDDWRDEKAGSSTFEEFCMNKYGIKCKFNDSENRFDYYVVDPIKYTLFQIKYV